MFYNDDQLKQKYYEEFAKLFISKGFGEDGENVENIIDILNRKQGKFIITDEEYFVKKGAKNISGNIFISPDDVENKALIFHEIFHVLIDSENRNGLYCHGLKEDFSDFENYGYASNEGAINCLVAKMLELEYSGEIQSIHTKPIRYKMDAYPELTRVMEQVDFFVGSKCLVRAMRFDPKILNKRFDEIAQKEGTFSSIMDKLDSMEDIEDKVDSKMIEYEEAKEKGDNSYIQSVTEEILDDMSIENEYFQAAQAIIIYNCFTKKIEEANTKNQVNTIMKDVDNFISLGLAENSDSFAILRREIDEKKVNYLEKQVSDNTSKKDFEEVIFNTTKDIRQGEFNEVCYCMKKDLLPETEKQPIQEGESK